MAEAQHLQRICNMIRELRKYRGLTQQELAAQANIRQATLSDIEKGTANFEINTLVRIAAALKCYIDINLTPIE